MEEMVEIYRKYMPQVYNFLFSLCHDAHLSEELTQETFFQALKSIDSFRGDCKIYVWLCSIAKHLWYKELKKKDREVVAEYVEETTCQKITENSGYGHRAAVPRKSVFPRARPSDRRAGTSPRAARRRRTARRRTADADRHPPALATEPRFVSASGARNAPESRRFDLAPRSRPQIAGNGRHELHAPIGGGRPGTGHTRSGRHRPRGNVQTRSALHPAARAEPPRLRQLRLPRQAFPIRLDRGKPGRDARSRTAAKSRRSLRARLDAPLFRPVQRVSAAHFPLARIPRRLQRSPARIHRDGKAETEIERDARRQRAETLACSIKKTYFCGI